MNGAIAFEIAVRTSSSILGSTLLSSALQGGVDGVLAQAVNGSVLLTVAPDAVVMVALPSWFGLQWQRQALLLPAHPMPVGLSRHKCPA